MKHINILLLTAVFLLPGCKDYLSVTPDKSLTVPTIVSDLQALLEQPFMFSSSPSGTVLGADNYYLEYPTWQSWSLVYRNSYIWAPDIYEGAASSHLDWGKLYKVIYTSNIVLKGLQNIPDVPISQKKYDLAKGMAFFYRAFSFFGLAQEYAPPYIETSSGTDLGIPLRLTPDLEQTKHRVSVDATYKQIIKDLKISIELLPAMVQVNHLNRPSRAAAYALLARIFLSMSQYREAELYADSSLQLHDDLLDYNTIDPTARFPFPKDNPELMLQCYIDTHASIIDAYAKNKLVDTVLYNSYEDGDLRKKIFFSLNDNNRPYYNGSYTGNIALFNGMATDESYLIRAECLARSGKIDAALKDLNKLLKARWSADSYNPYVMRDKQDLLEEILLERRKELIFRGLRWNVLRRLNQESKYSRTLTRILNGKVYTLPPNDLRYTYPIPDDEIELNSIIQNKR